MRERAAHIADKVKKAKPIDGATPPRLPGPRLPGARSTEFDRKSRAEGLMMFDNLRHALRSVADIVEKRGA